MNDARERRVRELMQRTNLPEDEARLAVAIEAGESSGDVIALDEKSGREAPRRIPRVGVKP